MSKQTVRLVNMTSTEVFKLQAQNIYAKLRHDNSTSNSTVSFMPTHLGGVMGQKEILESGSVMRQTRISQ